jgi:hypothetical protein
MSDRLTKERVAELARGAAALRAQLDRIKDEIDGYKLKKFGDDLEWMLTAGPDRLHLEIRTTTEPIEQIWIDIQDEEARKWSEVIRGVDPRPEVVYRGGWFWVVGVVCGALLIAAIWWLS